VTFLNDLQIEKLLIIYDLCNRIPSTIDKLKELLGKYFARVGLKTINQIADKAEKVRKGIQLMKFVFFRVLSYLLVQ